MLLKNLPSEKQIKVFFQNKFDINDPSSELKVCQCWKEKDGISIKIQYNKEVCFVPSFYYSLDYFHTNLKEFTIKIDREHFEHFNKNFILLDEYFKDLKKDIQK